jgi:hypothetical protein
MLSVIFFIEKELGMFIFLERVVVRKVVGFGRWILQCGLCPVIHTLEVRLHGGIGEDRHIIYVDYIQ